MEAYNVFKSFRRNLKNRLDTAKSNYIRSRIDEAESPNDYWRILKSLGLSSQGHPSPLLHFSPETLCKHYAGVLSVMPPLLLEEVDQMCGAQETSARSGAEWHHRLIVLQELKRRVLALAPSGIIDSSGSRSSRDESSLWHRAASSSHRAPGARDNAREGKS
ncbi:unnamed protein product [Trichogramma brassicae]|uniref:Uncharacterized protein n=1 Tax=Trichogramma brassicae TaxID=86971 RepID=A0A6H5IK81_9HYME|nr:unnamed protein product [Trichogramma brassicae]